jgi:hypothetical protein
MSDKPEPFKTPKNPMEWVDSLGLRGSIIHLAEIVYGTAEMSNEEKPWEDTPDKIIKPEGRELPNGFEGNPDASGWQVTRMPEKENQKLWQIVDARNMRIAWKFRTREEALEYVDWGRANRRTLTAKPKGDDKGD